MTLVEVNALQVSFGEKTAVSAASFAIEKGETFSLIGESGCGKSTILRVLAGLQREWNGRISLLGDALRPGLRFEGELRRNVQMVFQDPWASLHPEPHRCAHAVGAVKHPRRNADCGESGGCAAAGGAFR
ncbi:ABC transporter-like protein [Enterobacter asburiae]|uniref:ABC transporter-like protein n=1 Tax=Enterobacter asburiae TaxID=61645 RepID=A0A376F4T0_ENTAS|nr:ABC transporter-like protein [Enterobacter asburiae]